MSVALAFPQQAARRPHYRLRRILIETGSAILGVVLLIWSLLPVYNMFLIALDPEEGEIEFIGLLTVVLTVVIGSLASFAVSRLRLSKGPLLTNTALLTYMIPASFLIVPYYRIMHAYGLSDSLWGVIAAQVAFAIPFAILILHLYASLIPLELDDAARVDGASPIQVYLRIYLPLMVPALAVVAIYALLLAWNDY